MITQELGFLTADRLAALDALVKTIVEAVHPIRIVLFGSTVRGQAGPDSDLDLLVVMPDGTHRRQTAQYLYGHIEGVRIPYDIIVATSTDLAEYGQTQGLVYRDVLREGTVVYAA